MMEKPLYFAYGSNINLDQMRYRCPDATVYGQAVLDNYDLRFRGSGVATVEPKEGPDQANVTLCARQDIPHGHAAVRRQSRQLRQRVQHRAAVQRIRARRALPHRHPLDEADVDGILSCKSGKRRNFIIVEAAEQDGVQLHAVEPGIEQAIVPTI